MAMVTVGRIKIDEPNVICSIHRHFCKSNTNNNENKVKQINKIINKNKEQIQMQKRANAI